MRSIAFECNCLGPISAVVLVLVLVAVVDMDNDGLVVLPHERQGPYVLAEAAQGWCLEAQRQFVEALSHLRSISTLSDERRRYSNSVLTIRSRALNIVFAWEQIQKESARLAAIQEEWWQGRVGYGVWQ